MATAVGKVRCATCGKENAILKCEGCMKTFCWDHVMDHRQELSKELDGLEVIRDTVRQRLIQQIEEPRRHTLIEQIDEWEHKSIEKIRQAAEEARQMLLEHTPKYNTDIEVKLNQLTDQVRASRPKNFSETDLHQWQQTLTQLNNELIKPSKIKIGYHPTPLVEKISIDISLISNTVSINPNARWTQYGDTVAGRGGCGNRINQLYNVHGYYVDDEDQTVYAADYNNHRIVACKIDGTNGQVVAGGNEQVVAGGNEQVVVGGNEQGNQAYQLSCPTAVVLDKGTDSLIISDSRNRRIVRWSRQNGTSGETIISDINCWGLAMDNYGYFYVSDCNRHEVKRWKIGETNGIVVAGGNGQGNRLDQLNSPHHIFVDQENSVYVSDTNNHRVMKWMEGAKEGVVVAGGQNAGNSLTQLNNPCGVVADQLGTVYVADTNNYRVMRWLKGATQGSIVVGGTGAGAESHQFNYCWNLSFDRKGNLYVVDKNNHRVQKFNIDPNSNT